MRVNTKVSNKNVAYLATALIVIVNVVCILIPLFFLYIFPTSTLTSLFFSFPGFLLFVFGIIFLIYFVVVGVYSFEFKADNYIIEIRSKRTISSYFYTKSNYIDMPISSIEKFSFFNRSFTFNTTLMVKVRVSHRRSIAKRFNFTFLSKAQEQSIIETLEKIVHKNRLDG
ncbi:MAG: hypothetical protein VYD71_00915 [Bacteroidota bacterium]|nr:hypothetical protein [Bacteroidota bacterium]